MSNPFDPAEPPVLLSVSDLNRQARNLLESHFDFVWVEGEISNFASPSSGHWYFSLKDGDAQVRCAMFRGRNQRVKFRPGNGDAIRLRARVSLYEGRGEFQLIVEHMEHSGAGALQAAFEKLKARLLAEGLFEQSLKQPLPTAPGHLGVITSPTGAAIHDILTVLSRRCPSIDVSVLPVAVQGEGAAREIAAAIERANRWHREGKVSLDALIVGRGGGSLEDLWAFNEEIVARAIAASALPIVSAVGHEVDFSIADMVADQRAATPSAAAELLSPDQSEWLALLERYQRELHGLVSGRIVRLRTDLNHLRARLKHPGARLREQAQRLDDLEQRLLLAQANGSRARRAELDLLASRLNAQSPQPRITNAMADVHRLEQRLRGAVKNTLGRAGDRLAHLEQVMQSLSPQRTLDRGYAIITDESGRPLRDAARTKPGDKVQARLAMCDLTDWEAELREWLTSARTVQDEPVNLRSA
ncbi:MAG: exodeoxyribonuclease VII large subunit, partial [Halioglobus sp.]